MLEGMAKASWSQALCAFQTALKPHQSKSDKFLPEDILLNICMIMVLKLLDAANCNMMLMLKLSISCSNCNVLLYSSLLVLGLLGKFIVLVLPQRQWSTVIPLIKPKQPKKQTKKKKPHTTKPQKNNPQPHPHKVVERFFHLRTSLLHCKAVDRQSFLCFKPHRFIFSYLPAYLCSNSNILTFFPAFYHYWLLKQVMLD